MNPFDSQNLNWIAALLTILMLTLFLCTSYVSADPMSSNQTAAISEPQEEEVLVVAINEDYKEKSARLMREANFFFKKRHYRGALQRAEEVLKLDKDNKDARALQVLAKSQMRSAEKELMNEANRYYQLGDYVAAVQLYNKYLDELPLAHPEIRSKIINSYYNLGVRNLKDWHCHSAADYFRQVLFIDGKHIKSIDGLRLAIECDRDEIEKRKAVALMGYLP